MLWSCKNGEESKGLKEAKTPNGDASEYALDVPILPIKAGDTWKYQVSVEVPPGVTTEAGSAMELGHTKTRTYLGKVFVAQGLPEVDAFDIRIPGQPLERELVEIKEDRVLMRGVTRPEQKDAIPMWLDVPIPFVIAGMRPGQELANIGVEGGSHTRGIRVVARERVIVPAGEYDAIRLLMLGNDGEFEIRRTSWFAPGVGIVKEEKARYAREKLIVREITELVETSVKKR